MGIRLRKSFKVGAARINVSKSGIGGSIGVKGARIGRTANGRTRTTVGIPGTGISYVSESSGKGRTATATASSSQEYSPKAHKVSGIFLRIMAAVIILLSLLLLLIGLKIAYVFIAIGVIIWFIGGAHIKKGKSNE